MNHLSTKTGVLTKSRRAFLEKSGSALAMSLFGLSFFTSCADEDGQNPQPPTNPGADTGISVSGNTITIDLSKQTNLSRSGGWILITEARTLVVNTGAGYSALTSVCTHSGCDRNWTFSSNRFTCTCHNSQFDTNGNVLQGPANTPLEKFDVSESNGFLTISK